MKYSNIDFTNDVKVLGRVVSIAVDNKIAEAEQVFDTPFKYNDINKFHIDENKTGLDQYEINRLFRDKIWAMDNAGLVPDANNELHITNKAVFEGDTVFNDDANFNKGINVKGDIKNTEGKIITPEIDTDFGKFVRAEVTSTGDDAFKVHGKITANNLDVNGIIHAIGGLTVDGKSIFNDKVQITKGGIDVTGSSVFHDFVKFEDKIEVDGEAKFNGKVIIKNGDADVDLDWIIEKINYLLECCEEVKNGGGTTPTPTPTPTKYTITYKDGSTTLSTQQYEAGATISPISNPTKSGYTFTGWSPALPSTMPASNLTVTALWTENTPDPGPQEETKYTLTYRLSLPGIDRVYAEQQYEEGDTIVLPEPPASDTYEFIGWDGLPSDMKMPARSFTVVSNWNENTGGDDADGPIDIWAFGDNAYTTGFDKPDSSSASPTRMNDAERATWHERIDGEGSVTVYFYPVEGYKITGASVELDERSSTIHNNETVSSQFTQAGTVNGTPYYSVTFNAVYNDFDPNDSDARHNMHVRITTAEDGGGNDDTRYWGITSVAYEGEIPDGIPYIGLVSHPIDQYVTDGKLVNVTENGYSIPGAKFQIRRNDGYDGTVSGQWVDYDTLYEGRVEVPYSEDGSPVEFAINVVPDPGYQVMRIYGTRISGENWSSSNWDAGAKNLTFPVYYSDLVEGGGSGVTFVMGKEESIGGESQDDRTVSFGFNSLVTKQGTINDDGGIDTVPGLGVYTSPPWIFDSKDERAMAYLNNELSVIDDNMTPTLQLKRSDGYGGTDPNQFYPISISDLVTLPYDGRDDAEQIQFVLKITPSAGYSLLDVRFHYGSPTMGGGYNTSYDASTGELTFYARGGNFYRELQGLDRDYLELTFLKEDSGDTPKQYSISHIGDSNSRMEGVPMAVYGPNGTHICHAYAKDGYKISSVNVKLGTSYDDNGNPATDVTNNTDYCNFSVVDDTEWTVSLSNINSNVGILVNTVAL